MTITGQPTDIPLPTAAPPASGSPTPSPLVLDLDPDELETLAVLVHAAAKVGKTTLTSTAPLPLCALDAEGGWKFIKRVGFCRAGVHGGPDCPCPRLRRRKWDPVREPPPRHDGTWDFCHVMVRDWQTLDMARQWLASTQPHDFASLVMDSVTEAQRRLKLQLVGSEAMKIQDWGNLLTKMDSLIRGFRDLVLVPNSPLKLVVFIAETRETNGKWTPYMQGQISVSLPYWMDVVGYLFPEAVADANGQPTGTIRRLLVGSHPQFVTGERVQGRLGDVIDSPHLGRILDQVFGRTAPAALAVPPLS